MQASLISLAACTSDPVRPQQACEAPVPTATPTQPAETTSIQLTATIQDLMDAVVDPSADFIWDSVATISRMSGVEERQPRTDDEWKEVRRHALTLVEATNLLQMKGRRVSSTYFAASGYGGDLDSNAMQAKIDANRPTFDAFARGVHHAGLEVLAAIDAHDAAKLFEVGSVLDQACENCHTTFWYPNPQH